MNTIATGTLAKWGNSQGVRIPKDMCDLLGLRVGSPVDIEANVAKSELTLKAAHLEKKYSRSRRVSIEELCKGWHGNKVGEEWGGEDVGAEVVA